MLSDPNRYMPLLVFIGMGVLSGIVMAICYWHSNKTERAAAANRKVVTSPSVRLVEFINDEINDDWTNNEPIPLIPKPDHNEIKIWTETFTMFASRGNSVAFAASNADEAVKQFKKRYP